MKLFMNIFKRIYDYRELLKTSIKKDIGGKYKNSFLGVLWSFVNPLLQIIVYAIIFPLIMKSDIPNYVVFMVCGLIPWNYFSTVINRASFVMIENGNIIKKVYFPREILPLSLVTSETVNFLISSILILLFALGYGVHLNILYILFYPLVLLVQYVLLLGISLIVSSVTVYFRDLQHFIGVLLQLFFYATPIVYAVDVIPANFRWILKLNPMTYIIEGYRDIFWQPTMPNITNLLVVLAIGIAICIIVLFRIFSSSISYIVIRMFRWKAKSPKEIKESAFYNPLRVFITIFGIYLGICFLREPLDIPENVMLWVTRIFKVAVIIAISKGFAQSFTVDAKFIQKIREKSSKKMDDSSVEIILKIVRAIIYVIAGGFVLTELGVDLSGLIAGLGIGGIIIGIRFRFLVFFLIFVCRIIRFVGGVFVLRLVAARLGDFGLVCLDNGIYREDNIPNRVVIHVSALDGGQIRFFLAFGFLVGKALQPALRVNYLDDIVERLVHHLPRLFVGRRIIAVLLHPLARDLDEGIVCRLHHRDVVSQTKMRHPILVRGDAHIIRQVRHVGRTHGAAILRHRPVGIDFVNQFPRIFQVRLVVAHLLGEDVIIRVFHELPVKRV